MKKLSVGKWWLNRLPSKCLSWTANLERVAVIPSTAEREISPRNAALDTTTTMQPSPFSFARYIGASFRPFKKTTCSTPSAERTFVSKTWFYSNKYILPMPSAQHDLAWKSSRTIRVYELICYFTLRIIMSMSACILMHSAKLEPLFTLMTR